MGRVLCFVLFVLLCVLVMFMLKESASWKFDFFSCLGCVSAGSFQTRKIKIKIGGVLCALSCVCVCCVCVVFVLLWLRMFCIVLCLVSKFQKISSYQLSGLMLGWLYLSHPLKKRKTQIKYLNHWLLCDMICCHELYARTLLYPEYSVCWCHLPSKSNILSVFQKTNVLSACYLI